MRRLRNSVGRFDYVLASAVVLGLFGPFKPSELWYVLEESDRRLSVREMMNYSAYAGSLALYEIGPEGVCVPYAHLPCLQACRVRECWGCDSDDGVSRALQGAE